LESVEHDALLSLAAEDHAPLLAELEAHRRAHGKSDALAPVAAAAKRWLDAGLRVLFTARTQTQAQRLGSVLKGYGLPVSGDLGPFYPALLEERPAGAARVTVGALSAGFVLATEALAIVTEEEVFGTRARRRR